MNPHDYTPEEALEELLKKLQVRAPEIAAQVRQAIAEGKEEIIIENQLRTRKARSIRQKSAYTFEEALLVTVQVLRSHFIEVPLFINSAHQNFSEVFDQGNLRKGGIQIEQVPENSLKLDGQQELLQIALISESDIAQQKVNLERLEELLTFTQPPNI